MPGAPALRKQADNCNRDRPLSRRVTAARPGWPAGIPEQIKAGQSARVTVRVSKSARRMLNKSRNSGVSILGIKVISGSSGRLNRQAVWHGLRR